MKKKKLGMIPIFVPHVGCPHICIFCNQHRIANSTLLPSGEDVYKAIKEYRESSKKEKYWEVAFYGGTFTAINEEYQKELLAPAYEALKAGYIDGIRCSTRPDDVSPGQLDLLEAYGVSVVELGVQSLNDEILLKAQRGHSEAHVIQAVKALKERHMKVGLQFIPGLPGETWSTLVATTVKGAALKPDFVRIYPLLVIEETELADLYRQGAYKALRHEEAIAYCSFMKSYFEEKHIKVIRTGLQATEGLDKGDALVAGPYSPAFGEEVINDQIYKALYKGIGTLTSLYEEGSLVISYERAHTSKVRGLRNRNVKALEKAFPYKMKWEERKGLEQRIAITLNGTTYLICGIIK